MHLEAQRIIRSQRYRFILTHKSVEYMSTTGSKALLLQLILLPTEVQWVLQCEHGPNACTLMLSSLAKKLDLPLFRSIEVDQNITRLIDIYGGCERIMKTPVPLSYTRYTCMSVVSFCQLSHCLKSAQAQRQRQ